MPPVFVSKRSHISLQLLKVLVAVIAALSLILLVVSKPVPKPAPVTTTVKPVLALPDQQINSDLPTLTSTDKSEPAVILPALDTLISDEQLQPVTTSLESLRPDDTLARQQWSLHNDPAITGSSGLFGSYDYLTNGHNIVVAVVDSGVILQHEDLNFLPGYDFIHDPLVGNDGDGRDHDPSDPGDWVNSDDISQQTVNEGCPLAASKWHGTAISGIIGATAFNSAGIAGGSPTISMLPVRVTGKCGGYVSDLIDGIRWAAGLPVDGVADNQHPAQVINLSVGFPGACSNAMQQAINDAANTGAILVTAATNSGVDLDTEPYSPASCNNLLTVAATDRDGAVTDYTALGGSVFISAPGGTASDGIITTQNDGQDFPIPGSHYGYHYGTSIAAAHVSSAVANILAYKPTLTRAEIKQVLSTSASPIEFEPLCGSNNCGAGRLNVVAAMELLSSDFLDTPEPLDDEPTDPLSVDEVPVQLAAAGSTNSESVVTTTFTDDVMAGSSDWQNQLVLLLLLLSHLYCKRRA